MARLATIGFESQKLSSSATTCGEGQGTSIAEGTVTINTSTPRSGAACASCGPSARNYFDVKFAGVTGRSYFTRLGVRFSSVTPVGESLNFLQGFASGFATLFQVTLQESGEVRVFNNIASNWLIETTGFKPAANTWYLFELKVLVNAAGNGKFKLVIRADNGSVLYESAELEVNIGNTALTNFSAGHNGATDTAVTVLLDDWAVNDDQGANQNSFPGNAKIVLLDPISDKARSAGWLAGAGGTTNLWDALNNSPPVGVKAASATNTSQIKNSVSGTTETYEANLAAYTTAVGSGGGGLAAGDVIKLVAALMRIGNSSGTERSIGVTGVSNPAIAERVEGTFGTAETDSTGWLTKLTVYAYSPTVEKAVSPVLKIRKVTATTDTTMVDLLGLYVEYTPSVTLPLSSAEGTSSPTLGLKAKTQPPLSPAEGTSSPTLALKAKTQIAPSAAEGTSSPTLALTAKTKIAPSAAEGTSSPTLALKAPTKLPLGAAEGTSSPTLALKAPVQLPLGAATGTSAPTLTVHVPTPMTLGAAAGTSSPTLALKAKAKLALSAAAGVAAPTLKLRVHQPPSLKIRREGSWFPLT